MYQHTDLTVEAYEENSKNIIFQGQGFESSIMDVYCTTRGGG